jgi:hypothetical protein
VLALIRDAHHDPPVAALAAGQVAGKAVLTIDHNGIEA